MRHLVRLTDWTADEVQVIFDLADAYSRGEGPRTEGCAVLFFPASSLRTRVTFERGAHLMGLQPMVFPPETLDKPESLADVAGYLANWASLLVVRHGDITKLDALAAAQRLPVINAMTSANHPCEVLADVYALRGLRPELGRLRFLFVGADGNIARAWAELASVLGLSLTQCCPAELAVLGLTWTDDLDAAITTADVVLTDGVGPHRDALAPYRVTREKLRLAKPDVLLNPCPPFIRGNEISADAVESPGPFVGYGFKRSLLPVQQAVMAYCLGLG